MRPIQHRSANDVLGAPSGMAIEDCTALAITRAKFPDGLEVVISHWQPSAEQLALLAQGKPVQLTIWGRTHPPVALGVEGDGGLQL